MSLHKEPEFALEPQAGFKIGPAQCLAATEFINYQHADVQAFLKEQLNESPQDLLNQIADNPEKKINLAIKLFYIVRDGWRYNPYKVELDRDSFYLSVLINKKQSYCIPKALLLAGFARAFGIPARLGFGDVKNHIASPQLIEYLQTDIFAYHGYTELYLNEKWVQATPAFDKKLCKRMGVSVLDFNGYDNSLFQENNLTGETFMEYLRYHGVCNDLPYAWLIAGLTRTYPHIHKGNTMDGDLLNEV